MKHACTAWLFGSMVLCVLGVATGCSTPSLSPVADAATAVRDDGLLGEWKSDKYRATISAPSDKPLYRVAVVALDDEEIKGAMNLEMRATKIGEHEYLDLFLARSERRKLVQEYGGLAIPTHQIMRYTLDGDVLSLWLLSVDEIPGGEGRTHIAYDNNEADAPVLTGETAALRKMVETAPDAAFEPATEFKRVR